MALSRARLKSLRELQTARGRREQRRFLIDGEKLVRDALAAGAPCLELLAEDAAAWRDAPVKVAAISRADAERLSDTRTPQGVFAVIEDRLPDAAAAIAALEWDARPTVVALDAVQDPGNVGAIIRSAAAFGCDLALLGAGCADAAHPRVTRAATGAWFRVQIARSADLAEDLAALRERGARVVACAPTGGEPPRPASGATVWLFGNEGAGVSERLAPLIDATVSIPISAAVESLNVAVAAGVVLSQTRIQEPTQEPQQERIQEIGRCESSPGT